jgi:macrolide phosphotransferase
VFFRFGAVLGQPREQVLLPDKSKIKGGLALMNPIQPTNHETVVADMLRIAKNNGLRIDPSRVEINESGMDFQVAFVTDEDGKPWVLREPRRPDVMDRADNEYKVLQLLQRHLAVAVPNWRVYTSELIAYPLLEGTPAATVDPVSNGYAWKMEHDPLPAAFVSSLAQALATLHGVDHDLAASAGIRVKSPAEARETFAKNMDDIKRKIGVSDTLWDRWQRWIADDSYWPQHSALVHGDLHPPHILINEGNQVTGLLDWTEAEVTNPGTDFTIYYALFGESGLDVLLNQYQAFGGRVWPRMREHIAEQWAAYPVLIGMFALHTGKEEHMEMAQGALGLLEQKQE